MKRIHSVSVILGVFALCFLWATNVFATPQLTAKVNGITLTAVLSEVKPAFNDVKLYYQTTPFSGSTLPTQNVVLPTPYGTVATFIKDLAPNTKYYLKVVGKVSGGDFTSPPVEITTGATLQVDKLSYETPSSDCKSIYINGRVLNPGRSTYEVYLEYLNREEIQAGVNTWHKEYASKGRGVGASYGISDDGTYSFYLSNLTPNTKYTVKETVKSQSGASYTEQGEFFSCKGNIAGTEEAVSDFNKRSYTFLSLDNAAAKVLGFRSNIIPDYDLCVEQAGADTEQQKACRSQIGDFINIIIRILISAAAIILVLQIILKGYQYMISDIPKFKINAKERLVEAFLGLLLALSAYLILNTINPRLVSGVLSVNGVDISVIKEFDLSSAFTGDFSGKIIKVNFNKQAYPAALAASEKTGVDVAFILAIFSQETGSGRNLGACKWDGSGVMRSDKERGDFKTIMSELGLSPDSKAVSCPSKGGFGGAMGYTQVIPGTWLDQRSEAQTYLGHLPSPWKLEDALMVSAVYLKKLGGVTDPKNAACRYYSGDSCNPNRKTPNAFYGEQVVARIASLKKQIAESKSKGEIK